MTDFDRKFGSDDELLARLQAADPATSLPSADPSRVARLLEETMSNTTDNEGDTDGLTESRETGTHRRSPLTWLVAAAAVLLIAGVGAFGLLSHDAGSDKVPAATDKPTVTRLAAPAGAASGMCIVPNARILGAQTLAFEGTVQEITGDMVTLVPSRFYVGDVTDLVEVEAPKSDLLALVGAVKFEVGGRYLVSASDGRVTVCGFSAPYSADLAALYDQAFPS